MKNLFKEIIEEICKEEKIKYKYLSKNWVLMLEKDEKTRFISGYKFDLNPHGIGTIVDDKYAFYEVLKNKNIPIIEHKIVYDKTNDFHYAIGCNTYEYVKNFFIQNDNHIVIKPNEGTCGNNVFNVTNIDEIDPILDKLFSTNYSISICPFYKIKNEYRVIILDGEKKLLYKKFLPIVTGNGKETIRELLLKFNYNYFFNKLNDSKYDRILANKEKFEYNWKFNLSQGSIARKLEDNILAKDLTKLAKQVCNETNLRFGSIDIIETNNNELLILEANSGVMLENYIKQNPNDFFIAKLIYKEAIKKLFD